MSRKHRKPRKPFDWMTTYQGRRGTLQLIQKAIKEGWLNGPEHAERRKQLVAALDPLSFSRLQDREAIGMAKAYLEMRQSDLNAVNAAPAVWLPPKRKDSQRSPKIAATSKGASSTCSSVVPG